VAVVVFRTSSSPPTPAPSVWHATSRAAGIDTIMVVLASYVLSTRASGFRVASAESLRNYRASQCPPAPVPGPPRSAGRL